MTTPLIEFREVSKVYPDPRGGKPHQALEDLNLTIDLCPSRGCFHVFLGSSGCGKTTALNMLAGLLFPTKGQVLVNDRPVKGPGRDRGFVFQSYSSLPNLTALENVAFGLRLQGIPREERLSIAWDFVDRVGMRQKAHKYPKELSGGQCQRIALARTLAVKPEIVLFDEPLGALDVETKEQMYTLIGDVWAQTKGAFVYVTHDINEAVFLGDKVHLFCPAPGRIVHSREVPFPRPRDVSLLLTPDFNDFVRDLLKVFRDVARDSGEAVEAALNAAITV